MALAVIANDASLIILTQTLSELVDLQISSQGHQSKAVDQTYLAGSETSMVQREDDSDEE